MARVRLTDEAWQDLNDLDRSVQNQVVKGLRKLRNEPEKRGAPLGHKGAGNLTTFRKLTVGNRDYRIVYRLDDDGSVVVVWVIGRRSDSECYHLAMARFSMHENPLVRKLAEEMDKFWRDEW